MILFGLVCVWLIVDGLTRRTGIVEFPFLAACGMLGFLFPQAVGVVRNADLVPDEGLVRSLLMCSLCLAGVYWGWHARVPVKWRSVQATPCRLPRAYWFGVALLAVSVLAFYRLTGLSGGVEEHFSVRGAYALQWRGLPVAYQFFLQFMAPGLALAGITGLLMRHGWRLWIPGVVLLIPLALALLLGRRTVLIELCLLGLCVAYFAKGRLPGAGVAFMALPLLALAVYLAPYYRTYSLIGADRGRLQEIPIRETVEGTLSGQRAEFWTMVHIVHITDLTDSHERGRGLYNSFISMFVPKLLVGEEVKESLFWGAPNREYYDNPLGWRIPYTIVPSGPGSAYRQFWFLGALWFYLIARALRCLFVIAGVSGDVFAQTAYAISLTPSISAVVTDMTAVYSALFVMGPILLVMRRLTLMRPATDAAGADEAGAEAAATVPAVSR